MNKQKKRTKSPRNAKAPSMAGPNHRNMMTAKKDMD